MLLQRVRGIHDLVAVHLAGAGHVPRLVWRRRTQVEQQRPLVHETNGLLRRDRVLAVRAHAHLVYEDENRDDGRGTGEPGVVVGEFDQTVHATADEPTGEKGRAL